METYKIWSGTRTFLPGDDSEYTVEEIVAEDIGWFIDLPDYGLLGKTYSVYRTENGDIVLHIVQEAGLGDPNYGEIHRYGSIEEAAADGFERVLKEMRLI